MWKFDCGYSNQFSVNVQIILLVQQSKEPMADSILNYTKGDRKQRFSGQVAVCH